MKQFYIYLLLFFATPFAFAQLTPPANLQSYYTDVDFNKTGIDLFNDLATTTAAKHTNYLSYTPGIWEACKITDEDPLNSNNVLLIYGYNDNDGNYVTDRSRSKNANGGTQGTDWNREHTFPNSLGNPSLNSGGTNVPPYADAHNLRPADVTMNSNRGNLKFATSSGNAGNVSGNWYPGDEWKGDVARIIMYMYLRYGTQCLPSYVAVGSTNTVDANMINLLLEWNAQDPISTIEDARNAYHGDANNTYGQGNRNPFIDNPYLATVIWGGHKPKIVGDPIHLPIPKHLLHLLILWLQISQPIPSI
jgi:endonuclease I